MRCEGCPSRACLSNGGICDQRARGSSFKDCLCNHESNPPTDAQIRLVQAYLRYTIFVRPPNYTKQAYYEFIRDVVVKDQGFRYESREKSSASDEDQIMEFCQNDVWCEEY